MNKPPWSLHLCFQNPVSACRLREISDKVKEKVHLCQNVLSLSAKRAETGQTFLPGKRGLRKQGAPPQESSTLGGQGLGHGPPGQADIKDGVATPVITEPSVPTAPSRAQQPGWVPGLLLPPESPGLLPNLGFLLCEMGTPTIVLHESG